MLRVGRLLTYLFVFAIAGGHWGAMQLVAWGTMAANAESGSLIEAVTSGPCELCLSIAAAQGEDKEDPNSASNAKPEIYGLGPSGNRLVYTPPLIAKLSDAPLPICGICTAPPHGPPRRLA